MKRILTACFASLLVVGLVAPAAQAASKTRHFQDRDLAGGGELGFDILFKDRDGNKRFTPRQVTSFEFEVVRLSCNEGHTFISGTEDTPIKIERRKWAYTFPLFTDGTGHFAGWEIWRRGTRARGILKFRNVDTPGRTDCTTDGPRSWSAKPCRRGPGDPSVPVCRVGGGS
jgi:hypothetical protein